MYAVDALTALGAKYPVIRKKDDHRASGRRQVATLMQIFRIAGLSRAEAEAKLREELAGHDARAVEHIVTTAMHVWSGA